MSIRKMFFLLAVIMSTGCASDLFLNHNGNIPDQSRIAQIQTGQTREQVLDILGGPSLVTGLSDDHWIYMSSTVEQIAFLKPKEIDRQILAITFNDDKVSKIETRTLEDGNNIAIDQDETKMTDRNEGFFRKYFGGVGQYIPFADGKSSDGNL